MMNLICLQGRLTKKPELRYTQAQKPVAAFSIAVERDYVQEERKTDFVDIVAWNRNAEFVSEHFDKGDPIIVQGRLQIREWTDKDGAKRRTPEVAVEHLWFAGKKREDEPKGSAFGDLSEGDLPF